MLGGILEKDGAFLYDAFYPSKPESAFDLEPISVDTVLKIHSPQMVERVRATGDYDGALYSASGTVAAAVRIWCGEITSAFVFTGYGDHHAGSNFFGGGCYFNGAAMAIHELRDKFGVARFAIIDTDAHHGDGTWELFESDLDVLYVCFCSHASSDQNNDVNIHVPVPIHDSAYFALVKGALDNLVRHFEPEIIFWNWGYDGTVGEYGDMGLSPEVHMRIAMELKKLARDVCSGRLIVILCGGSRRDFARSLIPHIIQVLVEE